MIYCTTFRIFSDDEFDKHVVRDTPTCIIIRVLRNIKNHFEFVSLCAARCLIYMQTCDMKNEKYLF